MQGAALGMGQSQVCIQTGDDLLESSPVENDLGVLVDEKLDVSQQCEPVVWKANYIPGVMKKWVASRVLIEL